MTEISRSVSYRTADSARQCDSTSETSHDQTRRRFNRDIAASHYPCEFGKGFRAQREFRCVKACLADIPLGSKVLDLPCGSGRFLPWLWQRGFQVTAADYSPHMVERASQFVKRKLGPDTPIRFEVRDIMDSRFADGEFDAVLCHRLFHHFSEPQVRIAALRELHRISNGPVVVSFFNSFALDAIKFRLKHFLRGTMPEDRIPISLKQFQDDATQAGFEITLQKPVLWGLSPLWCLVLEHRPNAQTGIAVAA